MSLLKITESEKKRISDLHKQYQGEVNEKRITLKEGIQIPNEQPINEIAGVGTFFRKLLGGLFTGLKSVFKSTDTKVLNMVSDEMSKVISGLAKSNTKQVSMTAIKSSPGYKKSLSVLVENLSQTKYGLPYERLIQKEKDAVIKEASKGLNQTIITELKSAGKTLAGNIDNLKGAQLVKMGQKTSQITKTINGLSKVKLNKASTLLKSNAKLVGSGKSGAALLNKIKSGKVNIVKGGQLYSASTKSLGGSNVKVFRISNDTLKKLALLGITGAAVLFLIGKMYPEDEVSVIKDDGSDASEGGESTPRKTYYDCSSVNIETTPLTYGCKDQKIGQIQSCLGILTDNKFGPTTRRTLIEKGHDIKNGITKAIYDKVMADCKQGSTAQQSYPDNSAALTSDYMKRNPIKMDLGPVPELPNFKNTSASGASTSEGMTDTQYYTSLIDAGLFNATGIIGRTAYNGPALEPSEKQKLDRVLDNLGYDPSNVTATEKGARYVWQKR